MIDTVPAHLAVEESVIAGMLMDSTQIDECIEFLKPTDFFRDKHQILCRAIYEMRSVGKTIDILTVDDFLRAKGDSSKVGGFTELADIVNRAPHFVSTVEHARIVQQHAIRRDLIEAAQTIIAESSTDMTGDELTARAESLIFAIADSRTTNSITNASVEVPAAADRILERMVNQDAMLEGVPFGLSALDELVSLVPGNLVVVAARPSMGKTAFALNVAESVTFDARPVLFVSIEMNRREIAERLVSSHAQVNVRYPRSLRDEQIDRLKASAKTFMNFCEFEIDDTPKRTVTQIAATARRTKAKHKDLGLVVVDYLSLIDSESPRLPRHEQVAEISKRLKTLARELNVPVMALSQLNREAEKRDNRRPRMADLRESGAIEQDADVVILLHRPEYYDPDDEPGIAEVIVAKNRNGATGTAKLQFIRAVTRFADLEPTYV